MGGIMPDFTQITDKKFYKIVLERLGIKTDIK